ncbi:MAG: transposase, partial [Synergistaceae bacterium]|nr:transposase [Synergistaceae bacterium]
MPYIDKPINRDQIGLMAIDSLVPWDSMARVIDYFVDNLDLKEIGFTKTDPSFEGRPAFDPKSMLKLYLYGGRYGLRSSRKLEKACIINIEVVWMMGGLRPDFRTIADFRKDNIDCLKKVFKEFVRRVTIDLKTGFVSIDGSKFRAQNAKDNNFTINKLDDRIQWLEGHITEYLRLMDLADKQEDKELSEVEADANGMLTKEVLEEKLQKAQERLDKYKSYRDIMEKENLTQISLTDADARLMKSRNGYEVSYNVQTAVDSETHLIMDYLETNQVTDHGMLAPTLEEMKKEAGDKVIEAVADKGYDKDEDMIECLENGIIPNVILPDGQDCYELEVPYEEATDADARSTKAEDLKKCLHAGLIPEAYKDVIQDMEVVEVRRLVSDEAGEPEAKAKSPYGTEEEMKARAEEGYFVRDPERDVVFCPGGSTLRHKSTKPNGATRYANKQGCKGCPLRDKCIAGKGITTWKELDFSKDCLEKKAKWMKNESKENDDESKKAPKTGRKRKGHFEKLKIVKFKLHPNREKMAQRM